MAEAMSGTLEQRLREKFSWDSLGNRLRVVLEPDEADEILRRLSELEQALDFYANPSNWVEGGDVDDPRSGFGDGVVEAEYDGGARARAALSREGNADE
jgi:hypothetical protein